MSDFRLYFHTPLFKFQSVTKTHDIHKIQKHGTLGGGTVTFWISCTFL